MVSISFYKKHVSAVQQLLLLQSVFCAALILYQVFITANISYFFLGWNLFLAWVPVFFAVVWERRLAYGKLAKWKQVGLFSCWLLFWPNAPYLITDLVHINRWFKPVLWMDIILFFSAACLGLLLGLYSLYKVHERLLGHYSSKLAHGMIAACILLSSFGIYLGRIQRWNSWDIVTRPFHLISDAFQQLLVLEAWNITIGFSLFLGLTYYITYQIIDYAKLKK